MSIVSQSNEDDSTKQENENDDEISDLTSPYGNVSVSTSTESQRMRRTEMEDFDDFGLSVGYDAGAEAAAAAFIEAYESARKNLVHDEEEDDEDEDANGSLPFHDDDVASEILGPSSFHSSVLSRILAFPNGSTLSDNENNDNDDGRASSDDEEQRVDGGITIVSGESSSSLSSSHDGNSSSLESLDAVTEGMLGSSLSLRSLPWDDNDEGEKPSPTDPKVQSSSIPLLPRHEPDVFFNIANRLSLPVPSVVTSPAPSSDQRQHSASSAIASRDSASTAFLSASLLDHMLRQQGILVNDQQKRAALVQTIQAMGDALFEDDHDLHSEHDDALPLPPLPPSRPSNPPSTSPLLPHLHRLPSQFICAFCTKIAVGAAVIDCTSCEHASTITVCLGCAEQKMPHSEQRDATILGDDYILIDNDAKQDPNRPNPTPTTNDSKNKHCFHCPSCHKNTAKAVPCHALDVVIVDAMSVIKHSPLPIAANGLEDDPIQKDYFSRLDQWTHEIKRRRSLRTTMNHVRRKVRLISALIQREEDHVRRRRRRKRNGAVGEIFAMVVAATAATFLTLTVRR